VERGGEQLAKTLLLKLVRFVAMENFTNVQHETIPWNIWMIMGNGVKGVIIHGNSWLIYFYLVIFLGITN